MASQQFPTTIGDNPLLSSRESLSVPPIYTFASLYNLATRSYSWMWDEAYTRAREDALAMRRDAYLMSLIFERQEPTLLLEWHIVPEDEGDELQKHICGQLMSAVRAIPFFKRMLRYLLDAIWYGRAAAQVQWGRIRVQGQEMWSVVRHAPVNGDKIQWSWDAVPRILIFSGVRPELEEQHARIVITDRYTALELDTAYWRDRFLIHQHDVFDADFFRALEIGIQQGVGVRHWIYWIDWMRKEILGWLLDYLERVGLGLTIFYYEEGNPQSQTTAMDLASKQGRNTKIVWPRSVNAAGVGSGIERIEVPTGGSQIILEMMRYFDRIIERFIVGQSMSGGGDDTSYKTKVGTEFARDTKHAKLAWDAASLAETLTIDLLGPLVRYNYGDLGFSPRFVFNVESSDPKETVDIADKLIGLGLPVKAEDLRIATGFSRPRDDDEVVAMQIGGDEDEVGGVGSPAPGSE